LKKSRALPQPISHSSPATMPTNFERANTFPLEGPKSIKAVTKDFAQARMSDYPYLDPVPGERKTR